MTETDKIVTDLMEDKEIITDKSKFLSTGSTLLNLALTDSIDGGYMVGRMTNLIGDSSSGKTLMALTSLAEATIAPVFTDYKLIYDDVEAAMTFNVPELFGRKTAERIKAPAYNEDSTENNSKRIEDFHYNLVTNCKDSKSIYILDSFDALTSSAELEGVEESMVAIEKGKEIAGSYDASKQKYSSKFFRTSISDLRDSESLLLIISQTRDNLNPMSMDKKYRAGGKALKFYATHEIWLSAADKIKKKDRIIGVNVVAKVTKNKCTGKVREVRFPIYYEYGIDDVASCLDFLITEKVIVMKDKRTGVSIPEIGVDKMCYTDLIVEISKNKDMYNKLRNLVGTTWRCIEDDLKIDRAKKYE